MKTLAGLKRDAHNFKWSMIHTNSFFISEIPDFLSAYRKVTRVQADRIAFETIKDGQVSESWATFPKANQVKINALDCNDYLVKFIQDNGTFIQYHLVRVE